PLRSVMNSRRLMGYLSPRDHTLPYHCRNTALCITAKLIVEWQRWIKIGHCGGVRCMTALPPKAEVHPRRRPASTALLPPPALGERRHRSLARRLVAVNRRAVFVVAISQRPTAMAGLPARPQLSRWARPLRRPAARRNRRHSTRRTGENTVSIRHSGFSRHQLLDPEYLDITRFNVFALLCDSDRIIIHQSNFT